ncbi:MAG: hypothetical protein KAR42_17715 [candidate division Zixibacteria bacterium]|nr:hypothetical protein [candidate division Zixibacteria bacterium]
MREIKFRGMDAEGVWHYGYYCYDEEMVTHKIITSNSEWFEVNKETVGQLIVFDDKIKYFEDDIVILRKEFADDAEDICDNGYHYRFTNGRLVEISDGEIYPKQDYGWEIYKVIGNIHENPELLK